MPTAEFLSRSEAIFEKEMGLLIAGMFFVMIVMFLYVSLSGGANVLLVMPILAFTGYGFIWDCRRLLRSTVVGIDNGFLHLDGDKGTDVVPLQDVIDVRVHSAFDLMRRRAFVTFSLGRDSIYGRRVCGTLKTDAMLFIRSNAMRILERDVGSEYVRKWRGG